MIHLAGPREPRTNEHARARVPLSAAQVRAIVDEMEINTKSKAARVSLARNALAFGNISPEGKIVYREYLALLA